MKPTAYLRSFLFAAGSSLLAVSSASAALETVYWDGNDTTANADGGAGTWNSSNTNWDTLATAGANTNWDANASGDDTAIFGGTAGTVTVSGSIALKNLNLSVIGYTITGGTLAFSSGGAITGPSSTTDLVATISSNITGAPSVDITPFAADKGMSFIPAANGSMVLGNVTGDGAGNGSNRIYFGGGSGSTGSVGAVSGPKTFWNGSGQWTLTGLANGYSHEITSGTLIISGSGTLRANNRNTLLSGGTLHYNNPGAVQDGTTATGLNNDFQLNGGSLDNTSGAAITTSTYNPNMYWSNNWTFIGSNGAASNLFLGTGGVILSATRQVTVQNAATTLALGGVISGSTFGLTKAGAGTLELRGNSTYNGATTISAGTLTATDTVASTTVLGSSVTADATSDVITLTGNTLVDGNKVVFGGTAVPAGLTAGTVYFVRDTSGDTFKVSATSGGAAMNLTGTGTAPTITRPGVLGSTNSAIVLGDAATTTNNSSPTLLTSGAFTNERPITIANQATSGVYTIGGSNTSGTATYTGAITLNQPVTLRAATNGTVDFQSAFTTNNKAITIGSSGNTGTVRLTNTLSTTGGINVNFGTLLLNSSDRLGDTTPVTVAGGTLALGTNSDTVGTVTLTSGSITGTTGVLTGSSYAVQNGSVSAKLGGTGGLTKSTAGSVTLTGDNTYSGGTTVGAGTLTVGHVNALGTAGVSVTGGTLNLSNYAVANTITASGGTIIGANSSTTINFSNAAAINGTFGSINTGTDPSRAIDTTSGLTVNTLSGQGTFSGGLVTVTQAHNPGNSPGAQTFNDGLTYGDNTTATFEIAADGSAWDSITVSNGLTIGNSVTLALSLFGVADYGSVFWDSAHTFQLITANSTTGSFNSITYTGLGDYAAQGTWNYNQSSGALAWTVVPEPGAAFIGSLGMLALLRRRRS